MRRCTQTALVLIVHLAMAATAMAYEVVEDVVELVATDTQLIAVVDGRRYFRTDYLSGEVVRWQGAKGEIGAFLTNERLLAVTITSGQWNTEDLKIREKRTPPDVLIAAQILIMLTDERIVAFGTHTDGFFQTRLPIGETVVARAANGRVAAAATPSQAFGYSTYRRGAARIRFRLQERFVSLKAAYDSVTLQTSQRLITLEAGDGVWRYIELQ